MSHEEDGAATYADTGLQIEAMIKEPPCSQKADSEFSRFFS
jgi:hypothetical protein